MNQATDETSVTDAEPIDCSATSSVVEERQPSRSWIELKYIKGRGPYAYRRWRENGVKRSLYIGKVSGDE